MSYLERYLCSARKNCRKNIKHRNGFLYVQNLNKQWRLVFPSTFNTEGKNFLEQAILEAYVTTIQFGIEKTMTGLTDKFKA